MEFQYVLDNCHWIKQIDRYNYEMYLDHHALSTFRACEQKFVHEMIEGWKPKSEITLIPWFFAIGLCVHDAVEFLYLGKEKKTFNIMEYTPYLVKIWKNRGMELYKTRGTAADKKSYDNMGGLEGFVACMIQYVDFYNQDRERMRPIATEQSFGKGKEAPLGTFRVQSYDDDMNCRVDCFLSGRIEFLMDNGLVTGPMDHKTTSWFDGDMLAKYDPQEGMTGYIYASKKIIETNFPEIARQRDTNAMWMNYIATQFNLDPNKRFKRLPLRKTDWQLEQFRLRQLSTFEKIFQVIYDNREPDWNTNACDNMYRRPCVFKSVHSKGSAEHMHMILLVDFEKTAIWNPDFTQEENLVKKEG